MFVILECYQRIMDDSIYWNISRKTSLIRITKVEEEEDHININR